MKKITLDDNSKQTLINEFTKYLNETKFTDNKIQFNTEIDHIQNDSTPRPTVYISGTAYLKMLLYIRDTNVEIAWHGTVERNQQHNWYHIKDVFLYPQIISAATVNTDQEKYQTWLQNIEDDAVFNSIRFQGHSHVNMGTFASGTDLNMYHNFLQVLPKNDFYIFMIMNKSGSVNCFIYDLEKNLIYENQDIDIKVLTANSHDLLEDISKEKQTYCEQAPYTYNAHTNSPFNNPTRTRNVFDLDEMYADLDKRYKNPEIIKKKLNKKGKK